MITKTFLLFILYKCFMINHFFYTVEFSTNILLNYCEMCIHRQLSILKKSITVAFKYTITYLIEIINKIINESWNIFFRKILFTFLLIIVLIDILNGHT